MSKARLAQCTALAVLGSLLVPWAGAVAQQQPSGSELQEARDLGDVAGQSDPVFLRVRLDHTGGAAASAGDWRLFAF